MLFPLNSTELSKIKGQVLQLDPSETFLWFNSTSFKKTCIALSLCTSLISVGKSHQHMDGKSSTFSCNSGAIWDFISDLRHSPVQNSRRGICENQKLHRDSVGVSQPKAETQTNQLCWNNHHPHAFKTARR